MFVVACSPGPDLPIIGFALDVSRPNVGAVVQVALDRSGAPGARRIVVGAASDTLRRGPGLFGELERAMALAQDRDVVVVVGPGGSREALQVAPVYREAGVPDIVPTATSGRLHGVGRWTFMLAPDDSVEGEFLGSFAARELHAHTALLFYVPDEYGLGLASGTAAALARHGVHLLDRVPVGGDGACPPSAGQNAYQDAVDAGLALGHPDLIVLAVRDRSAACLSQATRARVPDARFLAGDGVLVDDAFLRTAGPVVDSFYVVTFWNAALPDPASRRFVTEFERVVGRRPRHDDAMFYDAAMLAAAAIRAVGSDRQAIRDYLDALGRSRPPFAGITGPIAFTPGAPRPLMVVRIRDGITTPVSVP